VAKSIAEQDRMRGLIQKRDALQQRQPLAAAQAALASAKRDQAEAVRKTDEWIQVNDVMVQTLKTLTCTAEHDRQLRVAQEVSGGVFIYLLCGKRTILWCSFLAQIEKKRLEEAVKLQGMSTEDIAKCLATKAELEKKVE
jgi:hypothetical protein